MKQCYLAFTLGVIFIAFLIPTTAFGQTVVEGVVLDAESKEPVPYASVSFVGTTIGTTTDFSGEYRITTDTPVDSVKVTFVGYVTQTTAIVRNKKQTRNFRLEEKSMDLGEVVIEGSKREKNPAYAMLAKIIKNKPYNDREKLETYTYTAYNKLQFELNNIDDKLMNTPLLKKFKFVFENLDSSQEKPSIPVFLTETVSEFYYRKSPRKKHELVKASKVSGVENESISQFTGDMYANLNIYDNDLNIFGKNFTSPIALGARLTYYFYITDSAQMLGHKAYRLDFVPRRYGDLAFDGHMWVADTTFAVLKVYGEVSEEANINFVKRFEVEQEYEEVDSNVFMISRERVLMDINLLEKEYGFYAKKHSNYRNYTINEPLPPHADKAKFDIEVEEDALEQTDGFWEGVRDSSSIDEDAVYNMVDTLEGVIKSYAIFDYIEMFMFGYKDFGKFELGPYYTLYSFNPIEGHRFRLGGRTTKELSKKIRIGGYAAYGLRDGVVKYGGDLEYYPTKRPWQQIRLTYKHDLEQLGTSDNAWLNDNILSSIFRRNPAFQMNGVESIKLTYQREWYQGLTTLIGMKSSQLWSVTDSLEFQRFYPEPNTFLEQPIFYSELLFGFRYAHRELFLSRDFGRTSIGSTWPVLNTRLTVGVNGLLGGVYNYRKLQVHIFDRIYMSPLGHALVDVYAGKLWGNVPFPLTFIHSGNETFFYDPLAYNLMNFIEFSSDEYVALHYEHHFEGFFFNRIPLFKRLKWREVALVKTIYGRNNSFLNDRYQTPKDLYNLYNGPYAEVGLGVENIFRFFRFDVLRRLTYLNHPGISKWGIRMAYQISF